MLRTLATKGPRGWLAVWLVALVVGLSAAPCSGVAAPASHAIVSAPADPCHSRDFTAPPVCPQMACQPAAPIPNAPVLAAPIYQSFAYEPAAGVPTGRREPPPQPPPRL